MSFYQRFNTVNLSVQSRGKASLHFEKVGVKTKTLKNRGKINIEHQSRGKNEIAKKKKRPTLHGQKVVPAKKKKKKNLAQTARDMKDMVNQ